MLWSRRVAAPSAIWKPYQETVMIPNELLLLSIPAAAAAFKLGALVLAVVWAARVVCPPGKRLPQGSLGQRG